MPRFSLRTLLILTAMLGVLFWAWPWMRTIPEVRRKVIHMPLSGVITFTDRVVRPEGLVFTDRFNKVAIAEVTVLMLWAGAVFYRRRFPKFPNSD